MATPPGFCSVRPDAPARAYLEPALPYRQSTQACLKRARDLLETLSLSDFLNTVLGSRADEIFRDSYPYLHLGVLVPPGMNEGLFRELPAVVGYDDHIRLVQSEVMTLELSGLTGGGEMPTTIYKAFRKPDLKGVRGVELFAPEARSDQVFSWIEMGVGAHLGIGLRSREAVFRAIEIGAEVDFLPPPFLGGEPAVNKAEDVLVFYLDGTFKSHPLRLEFYHSRAECERAQKQGLLS